MVATLPEHGVRTRRTRPALIDCDFHNELDSVKDLASFANGLKGRPDEPQYEDHVLREKTISLVTPEGKQDVPMLNALNEVMRESYLKDCEIGLKRWNRQIERAVFPLRLSLPSVRFRRSIGAWAGQPVDPQGNMISKQSYEKNLANWVPSESDKAFVHSLMHKVAAPGKMAAWIAPPERGINNLPVDYEYVRLH